MLFLKYILSGVFILVGLLTIRYAFRRQSPQEKMQGKHQLEMSGRGGRIHHFFVGCGFVVAGVLLLLKS